jgi:hypothetical protein
MGRLIRPLSKQTTVLAPTFDTIGGVFEVCCDPCGKQDSLKSMNTIDTRSSYDSTASWNSSGSPDHHKGAPLIVRKSVSQRFINNAGFELGDEEILGRIMLKSHLLPKNDGYYASNHVMINNERTKRYIPPLKRMPDMDELAREQARRMAAENELSHSDSTDLQIRLGRHCGRRIGENVTRGSNLQNRQKCMVTRGSNLQNIHKAMMESVADRNNIMDRRFTCMGVGTAKSSDGTLLYLCQLFRD